VKLIEREQQGARRGQKKKKKKKELAEPGPSSPARDARRRRIAPSRKKHRQHDVFAARLTNSEEANSQLSAKWPSVPRPRTRSPWQLINKPALFGTHPKSRLQSRCPRSSPQTVDHRVVAPEAHVPSRRDGG